MYACISKSYICIYRFLEHSPSVCKCNNLFSNPNPKAGKYPQRPSKTIFGVFISCFVRNAPLVSPPACSALFQENKQRNKSVPRRMFTKKNVVHKNMAEFQSKYFQNRATNTCQSTPKIWCEYKKYRKYGSGTSMKEKENTAISHTVQNVLRILFGNTLKIDQEFAKLLLLQRD